MQDESGQAIRPPSQPPHRPEIIHINCRVGVAAYLVLGREPILVDAGMPWDSNRILGAIRQTGLDPWAVRHIILTHYHPDHVGAAAAIQRVTGARVASHAADAPYIEGRLASPASSPFVSRIVDRLLRAAPVRVDRELGEGDVVGTLRVYHVPGHTPGSICLYHAPSGGLIVGDALRGGMPGAPGLAESPSRFASDSALARRSVRRLAGLGLAISTIYPAHGSVSVGNAERLLANLANSLPKE